MSSKIYYYFHHIRYWRQIEQRLHKYLQVKNALSHFCLKCKSILDYTFFKHFSPDDCFAPFTNIKSCTGSRKCNVYFRTKNVPECGHKNASYYYIQYQCVPSKLVWRIFLKFLKSFN